MMTEYVTNQGYNLLSKMMSGECRIEFTRVEMGSGTPAWQNLKRVTELAHTECSVDVERTRVEADRTVEVTAAFTNADVETAFYFKEKGVFATDGETEILFSYAYTTDPELIPTRSEAYIEKRLKTIITQLQDTEDDINIFVKSELYVAKEDYDSDMEAIRTEKLDGDGDAKNLTVAFSEAETCENIDSGETMATIFGKIKKFFNAVKDAIEGMTVSDPAPEGETAVEFISSISQLNGKIYARKKPIKKAYPGTSDYGIVRTAYSYNRLGDAGFDVVPTVGLLRNVLQKIQDRTGCVGAESEIGSFVTMQGYIFLYGASSTGRMSDVRVGSILFVGSDLTDGYFTIPAGYYKVVRTINFGSDTGIPIAGLSTDTEVNPSYLEKVDNITGSFLNEIRGLRADLSQLNSNFEYQMITNEDNNSSGVGRVTIGRGAVFRMKNICVLDIYVDVLRNIATTGIWVTENNPKIPKPYSMFHQVRYPVIGGNGNFFLQNRGVVLCDAVAGQSVRILFMYSV